MKYLIAILSASLLALGILVYYQGRQAERQKWERLDENRRHAERVSQIQAQILAEKDSVRRLRKERAVTDSIFAASISKLRGQNGALSKKLTELRPEVDLLADSVDVLAQFLEANDSLFANKAHEIALLNQKLQSDSVSHDLETRHLNNQIENLMGGHVEDHRTIEDLQTQLAKAEKKANKRIGFGINGGYGIQEHGGTITAGPTLSAGIHWTLFKL